MNEISYAIFEVNQIQFLLHIEVHEILTFTFIFESREIRQ